MRFMTEAPNESLVFEFVSDPAKPVPYIENDDFHLFPAQHFMTDDQPGPKMNGYQQMVRCGYIRGRYRTSFENPVPFESGVQSNVDVTLLDSFHTFKRGHRIMIQVQSSMFPLFDRNPQKYVEKYLSSRRFGFCSGKSPSVFRQSDRLARVGKITGETMPCYGRRFRDSRNAANLANRQIRSGRPRVLVLLCNPLRKTA